MQCVYAYALNLDKIIKNINLIKKKKSSDIVSSKTIHFALKFKCTNTDNDYLSVSKTVFCQAQAPITCFLFEKNV